VTRPGRRQRAPFNEHATQAVRRGEATSSGGRPRVAVGSPGHGYDRHAVLHTADAASAVRLQPRRQRPPRAGRVDRGPGRDTPRRQHGTGRRLGRTTRLAMQNVGHALAAAGANWSDVVKLTFFVVDVSEVVTIRAVRDEFLDAECRPASTLVRVAGLLLPNSSSRSRPSPARRTARRRCALVGKPALPLARSSALLERGVRSARDAPYPRPDRR